MKPRIGIADDQRSATVNILNALLADEFVLYTKTRGYHWNVVGPQFSELHKLFETQYEQLDEVIDQVAERARALDGRAFGTLAEFSQHSRLKERPGEAPPARDMIADLLSDHETLIRQLRQDADTVAGKYSDTGTNDFLVGLMEDHEKTAWMLRAHLAG